MKPKILMVTMGLNIGGAETHIIELSIELARRGYEVLVASNGGVYVGQIEAAGIRHFSIPLHSRKPDCMLASYRKLRRLIRSERPDIVHAHARIPAFITSLVRRSEKFSFITTAHGVYDVNGMLRMLSNWGDRTIAVSQDIRQYLMDSYSIPSSEITVTINGIDTARFAPSVSGDELLREFGLATGAPADGCAAENSLPDAGGCKRASGPVICHVSRLDTDSSVVAGQLITAMRQVGVRAPGSVLLMAGGGSEFDRLSAAAEQTNALLGRRAVIMAGPRTDIHKVVAACDVFVGVSRTALEAMSMEKPVILAGNAGFMGLFDQSKESEAKATNFCCRQSRPSDSALLENEIVSALAVLGFGPDGTASDGEGAARLADICRAERQLVIREYSVGRMTDDYERVYHIAMKPHYNILMSGYFGFSNAGDEAILSSIYRNLSSLDENLRISVLIAHPETSREIYDFYMANRFNIFAVLRAVKSCDILISGGGSLLQDRTSTKSIVYYLAIIRIAKFMHKKVVLYSNGIGPVIKPKNRRRVRNAVNRADLITLRDANSVSELRNMGVTRPDLHVTADPVFTFDCISGDEALRLVAQAGIPTDKPFVGVSVRDWYDIPDFDQRIAEVCDNIYEKYGRNIVFVVMQTPNDIRISETVKSKMRNPSYVLSGSYSTSQLMGIVGCSDFVICMRLHTLIFAAHMCVPTLGLVYDPKVKYYLQMLGMPSLGEVSEFDPAVAESLIADVVENHDAYARKLSERTAELRKLAADNEKYFVEMLRDMEKNG